MKKRILFLTALLLFAPLAVLLALPATAQHPADTLLRAAEAPPPAAATSPAARAGATAGPALVTLRGTGGSGSADSRRALGTGEIPTAGGQNVLAGLAGNGASAELGRALDTNEKSVLGPGHWHSTPTGKTWYGAYLSLTGYNAYCIDAGLRTPYARYFTAAKGSEIESAGSAYLLSRYSDSKKADVHAALSAIVKLDPQIAHRHQVPVAAPGKLGKRFAGTAKQYAALRAEAKKYAGPYTLTVTVGDPTPVPGGSGGPTADRVAPVSVVLKSASGRAVPGYTVRLSSSAGKLAAAALTTGTSPTTTRLTVPRPKAAQSASATVTATVSGLPNHRLLQYKPKGSGSKRVQNIVTRGLPMSLSARAGLNVHGPTRPTVTTTINAQRLEPGARVFDRFTVTGLGQGLRADVVHTLWHSESKPKRTKDAPAGAKSLGSVTSAAVADGAHTSPTLTLPAGIRGWVYWTESIAAGPDHIAWNSDHGIARETALVPWRPHIETTAVLGGQKIPQAVAFGGTQEKWAKRDTVAVPTAGTLPATARPSQTAPVPVGSTADTIRVRDARPGSTLQLTASLYHSQAEPRQAAQPVGKRVAQQQVTLRVDKSGAGSTRTAPVAIEPGWASWVVELAAGEGWDAWHSDYGIPAETVHRTPPPPIVTTAPPGTTPPVVPPSSAPPTTPAAPPSTPSEVPPSSAPPSTTPPAVPSSPPVSSQPAGPGVPPTGPVAPTSPPPPPADEAGPGGDVQVPPEQPAPEQPEQAAPREQALPRTGATTAITAGTALALVGTGILFLYLSRRRSA
ncbi:hypothetical protein [Brevibacterium moorei]|uniref:hypothetical protein n=1 Tax=Brevibacterium moorei TaxID=2968457 RepID=UPI00211C7236|nr:hypothetical protein [Brevibacterium sp. 68QC2CO]MCQ9386383.1 hypothetical protein [Brevibacterium sp. 68QC2CO]